MKTTISAMLAASLIAMPLQSHAQENPPDDFWLAAAVVCVAGAAFAGVYIVTKKAAPKYYWHMDSEQPPNFWVGTSTPKQCDIEGWTRIGGPYNRPQDAPAEHPNPTNRVQRVVGPASFIAVQTSTNGQHWTTVHQQVCDTEEFVYFPTNTGMFRIGTP